MRGTGGSEGAVSFQAGQIVGDYEIITTLGAGGMGAVYKARNLISGRVEAMKVLLPNLCASPELAERFVNEIKVLASLDHPNIAALRTALRVDNQLLMLMEFVDGITLDERASRGPLPAGEAVAFLAQVLDALAYAHSRGVVHRDIKPANIAITPQGVVKLLDFGIARSMADRRLTRTGLIMGSLYYMAPEQVTGQPADARSDLYSVGITLYRLVTGRRAIDASNEYALMRAQVGAIPTAPSELDPSIDPKLSEIIMRSIAKDPGARFQTAAAFRNTLTSSDMAITSAATLPSGTTEARWNPAALTTMQRYLAQALGPIASALVKRESRNALTVTGLFRALSLEIPDGPARVDFLKACARDLGTEPVKTPVSGTAQLAPTPVAFDVAALDHCRRNLAAYVGPVAKVIVSRAAKQAQSIDELYDLVAAEISEETDRRKFLASRGV
jgi:serine/threonine-protein kinase